MVRIYYAFILLCLFASCRNAQHQQVPPPVQQTEIPIFPGDTIITYDIEDVSGEGSEVKAHYINAQIRTAVWHIYGETGQAVINYVFLADGKVKAVEESYTYPAGLESVRSDKDKKLKSSLSYLLDTSGVLLSKVEEKDFVNVFSDFRKNVPLSLPPYAK